MGIAQISNKYTPKYRKGPHLQPQQHTGYRMGSPVGHSVFSQPHIRQSQPSGMQVSSEQITNQQQGIPQTTDRISSKKYPNVSLNQQRVHSSPQTDRMQEKNIDYIDIDSPTLPKISKLVSMNQQLQPNPDIERISFNKVDPVSNRLPERPARLPSGNLSLPAEKDNADQSCSSTLFQPVTNQNKDPLQIHNLGTHVQNANSGTDPHSTRNKVPF